MPRVKFIMLIIYSYDNHGFYPFQFIFIIEVDTIYISYIILIFYSQNTATIF